MAECLGKDGSDLTRADIYYNDNGTIKSIDDMDVWSLGNDGQVYKFPQKENCIINLDYKTFSLNTIPGASTHLSRDFELWVGAGKYQTLGDIVTTDPGNINGIRINNTDRYMFINNVGNTNIYWNENISSTNKFTISMTCKFRGNPMDWRDLWLFENSDQIRCEWGNNTLNIFANNGILTSSTYPQITRTDYFTIDLVVNGTSVTGYQNGIEVFNSTLSRNLSGNITKLYLCCQRGTNNTGTFGTAVYLKNLTLWKTALTSQELNDYWKFNGII